MATLTEKVRRLVREAFAGERDAAKQLCDAVDTGTSERTAIIPVAALAAGVDLAATTVFANPTAVEIVSIGLLALGAYAGIDAGNTCVVLVKDAAGNTIVSKTYGATPPVTTAINDLGTLDATHKILTAGELVTLTITNGATAATPAQQLVIRYKIT